MKTLYTIFATAILLGTGFAGGFNSAEEYDTHTEMFVVESHNNKGHVFAEPSTGAGTGEGVFLYNEQLSYYGIEQNTLRAGDMIEVVWSAYDAENSEWDAPLRIEEVER